MKYFGGTRGNLHNFNFPFRSLGELFEVNFDVELQKNQKMSYERHNYGGGNRRRRRGDANKSLNKRLVSLQRYYRA
jgi:hypothetical protein